MSLKNKVVGAVAGATLLGSAITGTVMKNEGFSTSAYLDSAGVPTICYGETLGVKMGDQATFAQCKKQLEKSVSAHAGALEGLPLVLPDVVTLGAVDMAYNVGVPGFNRSQVKRHLEHLDYARASKAVLQWKYIKYKGKKYDCSVKGNKVCYGLWKRRVWQAKAIGNEFETVQEATAALKKL